MTLNPDPSDWIAGGALLVSAYAAYTAHQAHSWKKEERRRAEVRFVVRRHEVQHDRVHVELQNDGVRTATYPQLDPQSVMGFAVAGGLIQLQSKPGQISDFWYDAPAHGRYMKTFRLVWTGPGMREQVITLPPPTGAGGTPPPDA